MRADRPAVARWPFTLALALRYLKSTRRDAFVTFLSATAAGGLALGTAALVLALAALTGFQQALRSEILERTPEIELAFPPGADAARSAARISALDGVRSVSREVRGPGWLLDRGRVRPVELVGFEGELPRSFPVEAGRGPGLYLGERIAAAWRLEPGAHVEIASSRPTLTPLGPQPRIRRLPLAGVFAVGRTEIEDRVALPLAAARQLLGAAEERWVVATGDLDRALELAAELPPLLPEGTRLATWSELNRGLFFALKLEKTLMFLAVFLIVVVAALALVSDLHLIIASKRPEIGMLGAMGATPGRLERVFVLLGGLLAALGVGGGALVGVGAAWLLDRFELLALPADVYFLDHVPFEVRSPDLALVLGTALLLSLAGSWRAARRAAALLPVDALRRA